MRSHCRSAVMRAAVGVVAGTLSLVVAPAIGAQGAQPTAASAGGSACVSPLPQPLEGGPGGFGMRGRGGRRGGPDSLARGDSMPRRRPPRARGCPPGFPDSLALAPAQKQQIVSLRAAFAQSHATELAQLQTISENARAARQAGQSEDQVRAISSQAAPIRAALRAPGRQLQQQVEATLTANQLAWMRSHGPMRHGAGRGHRT